MDKVIELPELRQALARYTMQDGLMYDLARQQEVYISTDISLVHSFAYIITNEFGVAGRYLLDFNLEDEEDSDDMSDSIQYDESSFVNMISLAWIANNADALLDLNIYPVGYDKTLVDITSRLLIFSASDISSITAFDSKLRSYYQDIDPDILTIERKVEDLAPMLIYVSDIRTYTEQQTVVSQLEEYNCRSAVIFSVPATAEERKEEYASFMREQYAGIVKDDDIVIIDSEYPGLPRAALEATSPYYSQVKQLYEFFRNIKETYLVIDSRDLGTLGQHVFGVLALAFVNDGKRPIFCSVGMDRAFIARLGAMLRFDGFPAADRLQAINHLPREGWLAVVNSEFWTRVARVTKFSADCTLNAVPANEFVPLIVKNNKYDFNVVLNPYESQYISTVHSGGYIPKVTTYDHHSLDLWETFTDDGGAIHRRYEPVSLDQFIKDVWGVSPILDMTIQSDDISKQEIFAYDDIVYLMLRLLEQTFEYNYVTTMDKLIVFKDMLSDRPGLESFFVGLLDIKYGCEATIIQHGVCNTILPPMPITGDVVPIQVLYDYRTPEFLRMLQTAYKSVNRKPESLKTPKLIPFTPRQTEMLLFSVSEDPYKPCSNRWATTGAQYASQSDMRMVSSHAIFMRSRWTPSVMTEFTPYGFRLLTSRSAPVTLVGLPTETAAEGINVRRKSKVFWEAFKHYPRQKGV